MSREAVAGTRSSGRGTAAAELAVTVSIGIRVIAYGRYERGIYRERATRVIAKTFHFYAQAAVTRTVRYIRNRTFQHAGRATSRPPCRPASGRRRRRRRRVASPRVAPRRVGSVGIARRCTVLSALASRRTVTRERRTERGGGAAGRRERVGENALGQERARGREKERTKEGERGEQVRGPHTRKVRGARAGRAAGRGKRGERSEKERETVERELVVRGGATSRSNRGESEVARGCGYP